MDSLNVLDYDPDGIALSEEFEDYFDLSEDEEEGSVHYSIEHARDSSQEDRKRFFPTAISIMDAEDTAS
uniref:Uncharacterized protein n=1 Tax=Acrobeloides nanus TaxID=290746 RepID=A0A914BZJ7_9BILA